MRVALHCIAWMAQMLAFLCCFAAIQVACLSIEQSGTVLLSGAAIWTCHHSLPLEMSSWNDHSGMPIAIALVTITTYKYKRGPAHSSFL